MNMLIQVAKMHFLHWTAWSAFKKKQPGVELQLLCIKRSRLRQLGHLIRLQPVHLPSLDLYNCEEALGQTKNLLETLHISSGQRASQVPEEELKSVVFNRDIWNSLLSLLLDGWTDGSFTQCHYFTNTVLHLHNLVMSSEREVHQRGKDLQSF